MSDSGSSTDGSLLDPDRFREFYDRALPVVYGYFFKRVGGAAVAADLTQETFVSAVRTLRGGAVVEAPMPWIVSIARRRLVDHFRSRTNASKSGTGQATGADDKSPWTSAAEARLVEAMSHLSSDHQLALVLRYVDDLTVVDVAAAMGRSVRATESVLARARAALTAAYVEAPDA